MAEIIWRIPTWPDGKRGVPTWTYGKWGGGKWSGGKFVPEGQLVDRNVDEEDDLDKVFKRHDINYEEAETRLKASAKTPQDKLNYWNEIIAANNQMISEIKGLRDSGQLGAPPNMSTELNFSEASPAWYAAEQALIAFELCNCVRSTH